VGYNNQKLRTVSRLDRQPRREGWRPARARREWRGKASPRLLRKSARGKGSVRSLLRGSVSQRVDLKAGSDLKTAVPAEASVGSGRSKVHHLTVQTWVLFSSNDLSSYVCRWASLAAGRDQWSDSEKVKSVDSAAKPGSNWHARCVEQSKWSIFQRKIRGF